MEKVKVVNFNVQVTGEWTCPKCKTINKIDYSHGPYTAVAYDPGDDDCKGCGEFFTEDWFD